jgi:hypothetical protein
LRFGAAYFDRQKIAVEWSYVSLFHARLREPERFSVHLEQTVDRLQFPLLGDSINEASPNFGGDLPNSLGQFYLRELHILLGDADALLAFSAGLNWVEVPRRELLLTLGGEWTPAGSADLHGRNGSDAGLAEQPLGLGDSHPQGRHIAIALNGALDQIIDS